MTPIRSRIALPGFIKSRYNLLKNLGKKNRKLEIGPGFERIYGFETLNILNHPIVDYVTDASKKLPFSDDTFEVVYSSHTLEHIPWYRVIEVLSEWVRVLKPDGVLEVWVPDGLKIAKAFVDAELHDNDSWLEDNWFRFNEEKDPCLWASGRIFTYGDGKGTLNNPNWHRAIYSERFLIKIFAEIGLKDCQRMNNKDVRGYNHGWINLGVRGRK